MVRTLEVEFINGDIVAQNDHENLLLSPKGIMISDNKGNEHFMSWALFLPYYSHLKTLEKACRVTSGVIEQYERTIS